MEKTILPYIEDFAKGQGCYITSEGEFFKTNGSHASYATKNFIDDEKFVKWVRYNEFEGDCIAQYAVLFKKYDRLRTIGTRQIESSERFPHIRFFNWILMDWQITFMPALVWNESEGIYVPNPENENETKMYYEIDGEYKAKIKEIKAYSISDRSKFFK